LICPCICCSFMAKKLRSICRSQGQMLDSDILSCPAGRHNLKQILTFLEQLELFCSGGCIETAPDRTSNEVHILNTVHLISRLFTHRNLTEYTVGHAESVAQCGGAAPFLWPLLLCLLVTALLGAFFLSLSSKYRYSIFSI